MGDAFGLVYCLAKEEDYEQVMKICTSKDYNGLDYLPAFFHRWLKEPGRIVLLAWMKDRVVALESALLVDGGQTVVFQGHRVVSDLRGSGIAGVLHSHVTSYVRSQYPEVCAVRMSRGDHPSERILSKYRLVAKEVFSSSEHLWRRTRTRTRSVEWIRWMLTGTIYILSEKPEEPLDLTQNLHLDPNTKSSRTSSIQ